MATTSHTGKENLPKAFEALVRLMPPRAIMDSVEHDHAVAMIDRLMASGKLSRGQRIYMETLVQLVEVYEAERQAVDTSDLRGLDSLKHLLDESEMGAADLARLLGVHPSMGSKILKGERSLTVQHIRKLADRFRVGPELFID